MIRKAKVEGIYSWKEEHMTERNMTQEKVYISTFSVI